MKALPGKPQFTSFSGFYTKNNDHLELIILKPTYMYTRAYYNTKHCSNSIFGDNVGWDVNYRQSLMNKETWGM